MRISSKYLCRGASNPRLRGGRKSSTLEPDPGNAGVGSKPKTKLPRRRRGLILEEVVRMKKFLLVLSIIVAVSVFSQELVIYTYSSFASGIAQKVLPIFEKQNNVKVKLLSFGDAGNVLARLILEKDQPKADVVIGLDQPLLKRAISEGLLIKFVPENISMIKNKELLDMRGYGIPFDYGAIALVYNTEKINNPPKSFKELLDERFKRKLVVQDPRTSSTGLSFMLWTVAVFGEDGFLDYWKSLKNNILTITPGWDEAFSMLETGEADIMVSYATDGAYSYHEYGSLKYLPVVMEEGAFVQIEYAAIVKGSKNIELAKKFIEFVLSKEFQSQVPLNQWMYPVVEIELPEAYKYAPKIDKVLSFDYGIFEQKGKDWLEKWAEVMIGK
ncbi:MAG: thiamine transport system substrate-binding protein [Pseudothermotoga sp.]|jgi:thiamine transport system substrate-binding protein|nr:thiamine transport system substrate-binding protein [Pseudothermotoga sp.]MDK2884315.1 thiamine transport system substrate-binding protein [Pseudothermotoga sp.]